MGNTSLLGFQLGSPLGFNTVTPLPPNITISVGDSLNLFDSFNTSNQGLNTSKLGQIAYDDIGQCGPSLLGFLLGSNTTIPAATGVTVGDGTDVLSLSDSVSIEIINNIGNIGIEVGDILSLSDSVEAPLGVPAYVSAYLLDITVLQQAFAEISQYYIDVTISENPYAVVSQYTITCTVLATPANWQLTES